MIAGKCTKKSFDSNLGGIKMAIIPALIVSFIIITAVVVFIIQLMRKGVSGIKLMLLGISITLFGGILAVDPKTNIGGI
jgi:hypothetical protein